MRQRLYRFSKVGEIGLAPRQKINAEGWGVLENCKSDGVSIVEIPTPTILETSLPTTYFPLGTGLYVDSTNFRNSSLASLLAVTAGSIPWSCANFSPFALFTNGTVTVVRDYLGALAVVSGGTLTGLGVVPQANSLTECNGQCIAGGLKSWPGVASVSEDMVGWSKIGSVDFTLGEQNTAGYRSAEVGTVFKVLQLDNSFLAYGTEGVAIFYPAQSTFGFKVLKRIKIDGPSSVGGDQFRHIFRSAEGELWEVKGKDGQPTLLGFKQFFAEEPSRVFYDKTAEECYFSYPTKTYVVDRFGVYSIGLKLDGKADGVFLSTESGTLSEITLETSVVNFGTAGLKTVSEIFLDLIGGDNAYAYLRVGSNTSRNFSLNRLSCVKPYITGEEFVIGIKAPYAPFNLSSLSVQTINVDGRFGQGISL